MKNTPKPTLVEERFFPFECGDSYEVESEYRVLHWHQEMEICYIKQGTGNYLINGIEYSFEKGDIFLINNDDFHLCFNERNLIMQVIMFDPSFLRSGSASPLDSEYLRPFTGSPVNFCNKIDGSSPHTPELSAILSEIEHEYEIRDNGYELMIKSLLLKFLTLIIRYFSKYENEKTHDKVSSKAAEKIRNAVSYIETHYTDEINLDKLAERFDISVPYLCSSFKTLTGMSPIDFAIRRRIAEAIHELGSTRKSIIAISEECGFHSLSNFNHLFKSVTGCSPREYRKKKNNQ